MPPKLDPASDRVRACQAAALELKARHGNSLNAAAKEYKLQQPTLNSLVKSGKLGIDFADQLAAVFETTPDGLVWRFLKGGEGAVRVGNIQGWAKAVEDARGTMPHLPYELAAEVVLPHWPLSMRANATFAQDLALVFQRHATVTQTRIRAQKAAP
jgi:hypothetical protein